MRKVGQRLRDIPAWEWDEIDAAIRGGEREAETMPRHDARPIVVDPTMPRGFREGEFSPWRQESA